MGLAEIESFCNLFYPPLSGQSPMNVNAVAYCIDSFTEDILEKVTKIFDGNIVVKCMELLAKEHRGEYSVRVPAGPCRLSFFKI